MYGNFKFKMADVEYAYERSMTGLDNPGFCTLCGAEAEGVEPDAQDYKCESCGAEAVYGIEEIILKIF